MASFIEDAVDARIDDMSRPRNLLKKLPGGNVAVDADDEDAPAPQLGLRVLLLPGPAKALVFVTSDVRLLEWECPQELPFDTALVNNANRLASRLGMPSIEHHVWLKLAREIMFSVRPTLQVLQITVGPSGFTTCHL